MVLNQGGLPLFSRSFEKGMDCCSVEHHSTIKLGEKTQLFSGFITALSGMATEFDADLKQLNMGIWDIYLESKNNLKSVLVAKTENDQEKQRIYRNANEVIVDRFLEQFSDQIHNFDGNTDKFKVFENSLRDLDILEDGTITTELCRACIIELEEEIQH